MDHDFRLLLKSLCIVAVCFAWQYTFVPPHTAKKEECIPTGALGYRWIEAGKGWPVQQLRIASFWAIGLSEVATILLGGESREYLDLTLASAIALNMIMVGMWLRRRCYEAMAENYTFELAIRKSHTLTTHGPYAIVRHPGYAAMVIQYTGVVLWYAAPGSWIVESTIPKIFPISICILALAIYELGLLASLLFWRIPSEDEILRDAFGKQWDKYAKEVPYTLFPGLL